MGPCYVCLSLATVLVLAADTPPDAAKKDQDLLQGTWVLASSERDGKPAPEDVLKNARMIITGNRYKISGGAGTAEEGTFTLDPSKSPKWLDATPSVGPNKGKTWRGIYSVDADTHRACLAPPGQDRPREFASPADSGILNDVWKKKGPE